MDSSTWSQKGQLSGLGIPRHANRPAVQQCLRATNHMKKWHFGGAHVFQILSHGLNLVAPTNMASYAIFAEYCPLTVKRQTRVSSVSDCKLMSWRVSQSCKYSSNTPTERAPEKSETHILLIRASHTVQLLRLLFGIPSYRRGASSEIDFP
jgi:hypothetical protein